MAEQERPRTEAALRRRMEVLSGFPSDQSLVTEALEAVRTEERQQVVREIREHFNYARLDRDKDVFDILDRVAGLKETDDYGIDPIRDDVEAGLNASESPKPNANTDEGREAIEGRLDQAWNSLVGDASESPPTHDCPQCGGDMRYAGHPVPWRQCGDASESPLPPEVLNAEYEWVGDASESGQPRTCFCGEPAEWPDGKCDKHHARRGLGDASESGQPPESHL